jgi:hypothetical protein
MARVRLSDILDERGGIDLAKIPLDFNYRTAVEADPDRVRNSISVLESSAINGRIDAGVFLMGLLLYLPADAWEQRIRVAEALGAFRNERCAALLCSELRRVQSTNTSRRYLDAIVRALAKFPPEMRNELEELAEDTAFSPKMRAKFRRALGEGDEDAWW